MYDKNFEFSNGQALTASAATTNAKNFGAQVSFGDGSPLYMHFLVTVAAGGTAPTAQFGAQDSADDITYGTLVQSEAFAAAQLGKGAHIALPLPNIKSRPKQYLRGYVTLGGTTPTLTIDSWLSNDPSIK